MASTCGLEALARFDIHRILKLLVFSVGVLLVLLFSVPFADAACLATGKPCGVNSAANDRKCCPGMLCGWGNVCQSGCRIAGTFYRPGTPNPNNPCQSCQPGRSRSSWTNLPAGTSCGNQSSSQCDNPNICSGTGQCLANHVANDTPCDDGNLCTQPDTCQSGVCVGAIQPDDTYCDDGDACTQTDACVGGVCTGSDPVQCFPSECRPAGVCDTATGACSFPVLPDGTECDDFLLGPCEVGRCMAGVCEGQPAPEGTVCGAFQCKVYTCEGGSCVPGPNEPNGTACGFSQCTVETCADGACVFAGNEPDGATCNDFDECTAASCLAGTCTTNPDPNAANGQECDDGDRCTDPDTCQAGVCQGPVVPDGTRICDFNFDDGCAIGTCQSGACLPDPTSTLNDGSGCDDGEKCTTNDRCAAGVCRGTGRPTGAPCDDGEQCTRGDSCQSGLCVAGASVTDGTSCDDGQDDCTTDDACQSGVCQGTNVANGTACDDGQAVCSTGETCQSGVCQGTHAPDGTDCDDGADCNSIDECQSGVCRGEQCHLVATCGPQDTCTAFEHSDGSGCFCTAAPLPNGGSCASFARCGADDGCPPGTACALSCCGDDVCMPFCN